MSLFREPAPTRFDLVFTIFGFVVRVHPLFWLIALLMAGRFRDLNGILSWVIVVFISILIHELGHTFAMRFYGQDSYIVLHGFGGLAIPKESFAYHQTGPRTHWHYIVISLAGPFAGFALATLICLSVWAAGGSVYPFWMFGVLPIPSVDMFIWNDSAFRLLNDFIWVNVFWGLMNLMPVMPLDGGNVSQHLFMQFNPSRGLYNALWLSVFTGALLAVLALVGLQSIYMPLLFGYLAYQSYQALQNRFRF